MKNLFIPKPHELKLTDNLINKYVLFNENW